MKRINEEILAEIKSITDGSKYLISDLSNVSFILFHRLDGVNWAGFYLQKDGALHLGPFCGKPACIYIERGKGVCGTALASEKPVCVPDVHRFPGHIACDGDSNSELVVPIFMGGKVVAVLDLDSVLFSRFDDEDVQDFLKIAQYLETLFEKKACI